MKSKKPELDTIRLDEIEKLTRLATVLAMSRRSKSPHTGLSEAIMNAQKALDNIRDKFSAEIHADLKARAESDQIRQMMPSFIEEMSRHVLGITNKDPIPELKDFHLFGLVTEVVSETNAWIFFGQADDLPECLAVMSYHRNASILVKTPCQYKKGDIIVFSADSMPIQTVFPCPQAVAKTYPSAMKKSTCRIKKCSARHYSRR